MTLSWNNTVIVRVRMENK